MIGLQAFRDCQTKALDAQAAVRSALKVQQDEAASGAAGTVHVDARHGTERCGSDAQRGEARSRGNGPRAHAEGPAHILYKKLWPQLLVKHAVRLPDVNAICTSLKKRNAIVFLDWPPRGKAPKDEYRMQQPAD